MATLRLFSPFARGCFDFGIAKVVINFNPANFFEKKLQKMSIFSEISVKQVLYPVEKSLFFLARIRFERLFVAKRLYHSLLLTVQFLRNPDRKLYIEIAG